MANQPVYEFHAQLAYNQPTIWRRFQVGRRITVARFAYILMTLFEMRGIHLFSVEVPLGQNYQTRMRARTDGADEAPDLSQAYCTQVVQLQVPGDDPECDEEVLDAAATMLSRLLDTPGQTLKLWYDFGDAWEVQVTLERILDGGDIPARELPRVLEGEGFGIVEDCGGHAGLAELAEAFKKKKGRAYRDACDWLGITELDLTRFDPDDMNFRLKKLPIVLKKFFEDGVVPTARSIALIKRHYMGGGPLDVD